MSIIGEKLNLCHLAGVFFQVTDKLTATNLPHAYFSFHAARADKLIVGGKADSCDSSLMGVLNLPKQLAVINSICTDEAIRPATDNNLVSENSAKCSNAASSL